jgi:polyferredoxin
MSRTSLNPNQPQKKPERKFPHWIIPASIAIVIFIGEVASHLVAISLEPFIGEYQIVVWIIFFLALIATIIMAILEWRDDESKKKSDDDRSGQDNN